MWKKDAEDVAVMVLHSSPASFDDELEHRSATTVMASDATDATLPLLTNVAPFAAVKGAPRGFVPEPSLKAWHKTVWVVDACGDGLLGSCEELV